MHSVADVERKLRELSPWHFDIDVMPGIRTAAYNRANYDNVDLDKVGILRHSHEAEIRSVGI
jgi:hypothetical protein